MPHFFYFFAISKQFERVVNGSNMHYTVCLETCVTICTLQLCLKLLYYIKNGLGIAMFPYRYLYSILL